MRSGQGYNARVATWVLLAPYLVPVVAILATFGTPVAIIYVVKYFKALEKGLVGPRASMALPEVPELVDLQERLLRLERERLRLESRVQQLEILSAAPALPPARAEAAAALPESRVRALPEAAEPNRRG